MRRIRVVATRAESALVADRTDQKLDQRAGASTVMTDAEISIPAAKDCLLVRGSACRALAMDSCLQVVRVRRGLRVDGGAARGRQLRGGFPAVNDAVAWFLKLLLLAARRQTWKPPSSAGARWSRCRSGAHGRPAANRLPTRSRWGQPPGPEPRTAWC